MEYSEDEGPKLDEVNQIQINNQIENTDRQLIQQNFYENSEELFQSEKMSHQPSQQDALSQKNQQLAPSIVDSSIPLEQSQKQFSVANSLDNNQRNSENEHGVQLIDFSNQHHQESQSPQSQNDKQIQLNNDQENKSNEDKNQILQLLPIVVEDQSEFNHSNNQFNIGQLDKSVVSFSNSFSSDQQENQNQQNNQKQKKGQYKRSKFPSQKNSMDLTSDRVETDRCTSKQLSIEINPTLIDTDRGEIQQEHQLLDKSKQLNNLTETPKSQQVLTEKLVASLRNIDEVKCKFNDNQFQNSAQILQNNEYSTDQKQQQNVFQVQLQNVTIKQVQLTKPEGHLSKFSKPQNVSSKISEKQEQSQSESQSSESSNSDEVSGSQQDQQPQQLQNSTQLQFKKESYQVKSSQNTFQQCTRSKQQKEDEEEVVLKNQDENKASKQNQDNQQKEENDHNNNEIQKSSENDDKDEEEDEENEEEEEQQQQQKQQEKVENGQQKQSKHDQLKGNANERQTGKSNVWMKIKNKNQVIHKLNKIVTDQNENEQIPNNSELQAPHQKQIVQQDWSFGVILPNDKFLQLWNVIIIIMMIYTSIVVPYRVCFVDTSSTFYYYFDIAVNCLFAIDMIVTSFSAYYDDEGILIVSNKMIVKQYLKSWFLIDLISIIPFNMIIPGDSEGSSGKNYNQLVRLARLPRLYRLFRLLRLMKLTKIQKVKQKNSLQLLIYKLFKLNPSYKRLFKLMILALLSTHLAGCFYFLISKIFSSDNQQTWVSRIDIQYDSPFQQYLKSIEWSLQTLTTVGLGDIPPVTIPEKIFVIIWMIISGTFFTFMVANLQGVADYDQNNQTFKKKIDRLLFLQSTLKIPNLLVLQIKRQLEYQEKELKHYYLTKNTEFFSNLPTTLSVHILLSIFGNILNKVPFFLGKDIDLITKYVPHLNGVHYSAGDKIYQTDIYPEMIYFIYHGSVDILNKEQQVIMNFGDAQIFGEFEAICLISRVGSAYAKSSTNIFTMSADKFMNMIIEFSELQGDVMQMFNEKKKSYSIHIPDEDSDIINVPFSKLLNEWQEKYNQKGDIEKSLEQYSLEYQQLKFAGNNLDKNEKLASIFTPTSELNSNKFLYFENNDQCQKFLEQLGSHYNKDLNNYIENLTVETDKIKKYLKQRIDYYQNKENKLKELLETIQQIKYYKENISSK